MTIDELKEMFPLFSFKKSGEWNGQPTYFVGFDPNWHGYGMTIQPDRITDGILDVFRTSHEALRIKRRLEARYPHVYFGVVSLKVPVHLYVRRGGIGGPRHEEAAGYTVDLDALGELTPESLRIVEKFNEEAKKATQPGWFYCTGCRIAKPASEYAFFYFAGRYCNQCKESNPDLYNRAMHETYE